MKRKVFEVCVLTGWFGVLLAGCGNDPQQAVAPPQAGAGRGLPGLAGAKSLSQHYVEVTFDEPVGAAAVKPEMFHITGPDQRELAVDGATTVDDPRQILLTTKAQEEVEYLLQVRDVGSAGGVSSTSSLAAAETANAMAFPGTTGSEPALRSAIALSNTTVLLTFNAQMDGASTQNPAFYDVSNPDLNISTAVLATDLVSLTLTTTSQENILYTVKVTNVKGKGGSGTSAYINPDFSTATFYGMPLVDNIQPKVAGAVATSDSRVVISFTEPMNANAADPSHYSITPPVGITGAALNEFKTQVTLTTFPLTAGTDYTVTASTDLKDLASPTPNSIDPDLADRSAEFTLSGTPAIVADDRPPHVVNAVSTSDTTVVVTFSKPMGASADIAENYRITGPETSFLFVTDALRSTDYTAVRLETSRQADLVYTVHVGNVLDLAGRPIAAPDSLLAPPDGVDPSAASFFGTPPDSIDEQEDTDGDGFADWFETAGWEILVGLANGGQKRAFVTSDPYNPDTDGDGFTDGEENAHNWDPRTNDTDADIIDDYTEFNVLYSDPADQDTDDDGIDDLTEWTFFLTSTILADTDGDGFTDDQELFELNRNPLVADLPLPQITVEEIALELNITSSFTDEEGVTQSTTSTTSSTFTQSRTDTLGTSDTNTTESENEFGQKIAAEGGSTGFKVSGEVSFGQSQAQGFSSTVDTETAETSQSEYQESVTEALEFSENRSVTRNIDSAIVQATVNISNKSDIAFSITNIELSLLQQDRLTGLTFRPIAALRATGASDPTAQPVFNLGPLDRERGPIIFENTTVFPNRIDALMREPTGLVFKVVNFDVFDEAGRNLVFTSQEVADRTCGLTIDFGDGRVESYRVATTSDFGDDGKQIGITMERALEIVGILRATGTAPDVANTFHTVTDTRTLPDSSTVDVEALVRMRDVANSTDGKKFWTSVASNTNLDPNSDFGAIPLHAHETILLMYTSDVDGDGLFLREEYLYGSDDTKTDSDGDLLGDFEEVRTGWTVAKEPGLPYKTFPSPARPDSDMDDLSDREEKAAATDPNRADTDEDGRSDLSELQDTYQIALFDGDNDISNTKVLTVLPYSSWAIIAGADSTCDTTTATGDDEVLTPAAGTGSKLCIAAGPNGVINTTPADDDKLSAGEVVDPGPDGVCDTTTAAGDDFKEYTTAASPPTKGKIGKVCFSAGANGLINTTPLDDDFVRVAHEGLFGTDPVDQDTDTDGIPDGREVTLGTNPNTKDAGNVTDTDSDGLFDAEEDLGWDVVGPVVSPPCTTAPRHVTSDKNVADTDHDGLPDVVERAIGSDPRSLDTDCDDLLDYLEFDESNPVANTTPLYNSVTLATALQRCDDAVNCLYDPPPGSSIYGTHPAKADTDGDGRNDNIEFTVQCSYTVYGASAVQVFTDPLQANVDNDGLNDGAECNTHFTNPNDADTDDDLRNDGAEISANPARNPLRQDYNMRVTLTSISVIGDCDDGTCKGLELEGSVKARKPDQSTEVTLHTEGCKTEECCCGCVGQECCDDSQCDGGDFLTGTDPYTDFVIQQGESFRLFTTALRDNDAFDCTDTAYSTVGSMNKDYNFAVTPTSPINEDVGSSDDCKVRLTFTITRLD